jgi:hypothetical protein
LESNGKEFEKEKEHNTQPTFKETRQTWFLADIP